MIAGRRAVARGSAAERAADVESYCRGCAARCARPGCDGAAIESAPAGYRLSLDGRGVDRDRFEALVAAARTGGDPGRRPRGSTRPARGRGPALDGLADRPALTAPTPPRSTSRGWWRSRPGLRRTPPRPHGRGRRPAPAGDGPPSAPRAAARAPDARAVPLRRAVRGAGSLRGRAAPGSSTSWASNPARAARDAGAHPSPGRDAGRRSPKPAGVDAGPPPLRERAGGPRSSPSPPSHAGPGRRPPPCGARGDGDGSRGPPGGRRSPRSIPRGDVAGDERCPPCRAGHRGWAPAG